jgi:hypothetical protein
MFYGCVGGMVSGLAASAIMAGVTAVMGSPAVTSLNSVGAWIVRWLQYAAPDALNGFYYDATLGGILLTAGVGALVGAVLGGLLARFPDDQPFVWGAVAGAVLWLLVKAALAPALDPVLNRVVDWRVLLVTCLAFGLMLGAWMHYGRRVLGREVEEFVSRWQLSSADRAERAGTFDRA